MRYFSVLVFCLIFGFVSIDNARAKEPVFRFEKLSLIWTASYNDDDEQVFFSKYENKEWAVPVQVSDSKSYVLQAAGSIDRDGTTLVVWTQVDKKGYFLYFSRKKNDIWSKPEQINTGMSDNREPVMVADSTGLPILAWTGVDDNYSDVFWSRWTGTVWSKARKIHADDIVPDVNPSFRTNEIGDIELSWQTFSNENPVTVVLQWNGDTWVEGSLDTGQKKIATEKKRRDSLPQLPDFIQEQYKASFLYKDNYGTGKIPVIRK
jgi:hypothetical protein